MEASIGIIFGSSGGNTQAVAQAIARAIGKERCTVKDVAKCAPKDLQAFDLLVLGTCTLGLGDLQDDWDSFLRKSTGMDMSGKRVAFFGLGDQFTYSETFVDGMAELHDAFTTAGAVAIGGGWSTEGYEFGSSKSVRDGAFLGLALDEDNQSELSKQRIELWIQGLGL